MTRLTLVLVKLICASYSFSGVGDLVLAKVGGGVESGAKILKNTDEIAKGAQTT